MYRSLALCLAGCLPAFSQTTTFEWRADEVQGFTHIFETREWVSRDGREPSGWKLNVYDPDVRVVYYLRPRESGGRGLGLFFRSGEPNANIYLEDEAAQLLPGTNWIAVEYLTEGDPKLTVEFITHDGVGVNDIVCEASAGRRHDDGSRAWFFPLPNAVGWSTNRLQFVSSFEKRMYLYFRTKGVGSENLFYVRRIEFANFPK